LTVNIVVSVPARHYGTRQDVSSPLQFTSHGAGCTKFWLLFPSSSAFFRHSWMARFAGSSAAVVTGWNCRWLAESAISWLIEMKFGLPPGWLPR
jgi:hypothetical protein